MSSEPQCAPTPKWMFWTGWVCTVLPSLMLLMSGVMKLIMTDQAPPNLGWSQSALFGLAFVEIGCTILYLIPRTAILGAILMTAYLGGAVATHVRIGEPFIGQMGFGVFVWLGLFLRDDRLRAILPWRGTPGCESAGAGGALFKSLLILAALGFVVVALFAAEGAVGLTIFLLVLAVIVVIVLVFVIVVALQPAEFRISRSATMAAAPAQVFPHVNDFHNWNAWSPWAKIDPTMKQTFDGAPSGVGAIYSWLGNSKVGEGTMTITESVPNERVTIRLEFRKPFKATHSAEFTFKGDGGQTVVTWSMIGAKNFMFKAFHLVMNMDRMLGADFEKGLAQMKAAAESQKS